MSFNIAASKNTSGGSTDGGAEYPDFIEREEGIGNPVKYLNLESPKYAPFTGIVEVVPTRLNLATDGIKKRHEPSVIFSVIKDRQTGWRIGVPQQFSPKINMIEHLSFKLEGTEFLDLSIPIQRIKYICIKYSNFLKTSPNFRIGSKTVYEFVDREEQAKEFKQDRRTRKKADDIVDSLYGAELKEIGTMLNFDVKLMSEETLWKKVAEFVEDKKRENGKTGAERFMEIYNSETRRELTTLKRGLSTGVVMHTPLDGYTYNGFSMGNSEPDALMYLRNNSNVFVAIDTLSKQLESGGTQAQSSGETKQSTPQSLELERVKRELEETREKLAEANSKGASESADSDLAGADPELANLIEQAKALKLKGVHNSKDKEALRKRIEEAKRENEKRTNN